MAHANALGRLLPALMISAAMLAACGQMPGSGRGDDARTRTKAAEADDALAAVRDEEYSDMPVAQKRAPLAPASTVNGTVMTEAAPAALPYASPEDRERYPDAKPNPVKKSSPTSRFPPSRPMSTRQATLWCAAISTTAACRRATRYASRRW